jgi:hypothetical protein
MATLADLARQYLAQPLPDISGIFQPVADTPVEETPVEETVPGITPQLLQPMGGEDSFSVYNPDPTRTRTIKDYRFPFKFTGEDLPEAGDYISGPTGIRSLLSKLPGQQILQGIAGALPVNRRAILENQLLGGNFMLDDIGRIVTNNYNTPEGIMAGYNPVSGGLLNMLTGGEKGEPTTYGLDKAYDKRRKTVAKTLKEKYGMSDEDIEAALAGEYEGDVPINPATGLPTDLINRLNLFNQSQNLFNRRKNIADIITDKKIEERQQERRNAEEAAFAAAGGDRQQQAMQAARDEDRKERAYREETGGQAGSYAPGGGSGIQRDSGGREVGYNDPFDPGGGE